MTKCRRGILVTCVSLIFVIFFTIINFYLDALTKTFFVGIPFGVILGVISCFYMANTYDFTTMRSKNPNAFLAGNRGYIGALLGVLVANVIVYFFGREAQNLLSGGGATWVFIVLGYTRLYPF